MTKEVGVESLPSGLHHIQAPLPELTRRAFLDPPSNPIRGRPMAERFFRATALAGELHLIDFSDWDEWESGKLQYRDDAEVQWLMRTGAGERRVIRTVAELDAALEESASPHGIYLYVSERLIEEAKRRWEEMKEKRTR